MSNHYQTATSGRAAGLTDSAIAGEEEKGHSSFGCGSG